MSTLPLLDEPFVMPTPQAQRRLMTFLDASRAANSTEFPGLMLMSLMVYVSDEIWQESIADSLKTLSGGHQC